MGRHRKRDHKLPPYVYLAKGRYVYRPYVDGKLAREQRLCSVNAKLSEVWAAYEALTGTTTDTFEWLARQYLKSDQFAALAPRSQTSYLKFHSVIVSRKLKDGRTFGTLAYRHISPGVVRKYLDKRAKDGAAIAGNREAAVISAVFSWAYQRDYVAANPCIGVKRNAETARKLYVTDEMYAFVYEEAKHCAPYIRPAMELAYLCRMRKAEVLWTTVADIKEEGLLTRRAKGSNDALTAWTPRLRAAVETARAVGKIKGMTLIHGRDGQPVRESAFDTAWQRLMVNVEKKGGARFTFHDLKAKGVSDFDGNKQQASGHKTAQMVERYDRKLIVVVATK